MMDSKALYDSFVIELKSNATSSYNSFYKAYEIIQEDTFKSKEMFLSLLKYNDYVIESLDFYNDLFFNLDNSEYLLYVGQIYSLQIKASHNLFVIYRNDNDEEKTTYYLKKKEEYKTGLCFYYLMGRDKEKIGPILEAFKLDASIEPTLVEKAEKRYQEFLDGKGVK